MYADKDNQLIYESYITEGVVLREPEWNEAYPKWKQLVDSWPTEELQAHNKHIFRIIIDEARKREQRGEFGKVTGPDMTLHFSPVQKMDIGSGQEKGPSGVSVVVQQINADYEEGYMIPDADIEQIEEFWREQAPGDAYGRSDNELPFSR